MRKLGELKNMYNSPATLKNKIKHDQQIFYYPQFLETG